MSEDFENLKKIGAQKIYEKTHIARANVEHILNKSFDKLPKVQFRGFISILERDYGLDLQDVLQEFEQHTAKDEDMVQYIKIDTKEYGKFDKKMIFSALLVTIVVGYLIISSLVHSGSETIEVNNTEIETAKANLDNNMSSPVVPEVNSSETNQTADANTSEPVATKVSDVTKAPDVTKATKATKLEIIPGKTLWLAYIDDASSKVSQTTIKKNFDLDASKNYLFEMGHGVLKIDLGVDVKEYNDEDKKYFKFTNGELSEITRDDFKELSKGKAW